MKNTMRKGFLFLALALIVAGGAFAQRVGDTWQVGNETWVVQSVSGDTLTMKKAPGLDGVWRIRNDVEEITISGSTGIYTQPRRSYNGIWKSAIDNGYIVFGSTPAFRNLRKTGDLTWTGEVIQTQGSGSNATGITYANVTITLSADGQTLTTSGGSRDTWTRR